MAVEGRLQTRQWEDDRNVRHWKTEVIASNVEMLSGRRKKDYAAESAAEALEAQGEAMGERQAAAAASDPGDLDASSSDDEEAEPAAA